MYRLFLQCQKDRLPREHGSDKLPSAPSAPSGLYDNISIRITSYGKSRSGFCPEIKENTARRMSMVDFNCHTVLKMPVTVEYLNDNP